MKSLQQFLEAQNFLVKGHTKNQLDTVDLDLPSGIKWAICNIGANKPEDDGLLFQFGRIDGYKYDDNNHKFLSKTDYVTTSNTKYNAGDTLKSEDDAAYQATKGKFRIPTKYELYELIDNTKNFWTDINGVKGRKFVSKKDETKWIFIPAAGCFGGISFSGVGTYGYIWSASVGPNSAYRAYSINFNSHDCERNNYGCLTGYSVRGVLNK